MVWETTDKLKHLQPEQATKNHDQDAANEREKSRHRRRTPEHQDELQHDRQATNREILERQENRQEQSDDAQGTEQELANVWQDEDEAVS
jgi:hypothetical protein